MKALHIITWILVIVGGLNWLLYGLFGWEIGSWLGGMTGSVARLVYVLVGISAVVEIVTHKRNCRMCNQGGAM